MDQNELDDAPCALDMGFEPQIKKILKLCPSARQTLMFTATWPEAVKKIADSFTSKDAVHVRIGDGGGGWSKLTTPFFLYIYPRLERGMISTAFRKGRTRRR